MYGAGDVRVENVPDPRIIEATDAILVVTRACICGSDLWPYKKMEHTDEGSRMGHEFIGIVDAIGSGVRTVKPGDLVVRSEEHTSELQSHSDLVCRLLLEKKK